MTENNLISPETAQENRRVSGVWELIRKKAYPLPNLPPRGKEFIN